MLRDITIGQHFPGNSLVHRFDPRLKLVLTIAYIVLLFAASNPLGLALSILFLAVMYKVAKIPGKMILKSLKPILPIVIFTAVLNLFFVSGEGEPLVHIWFLTIYAEGVRSSVLQPGEACGYGSKFIAHRPTRLAVVACGYADGYPRKDNPHREVVVEGKKVPVIGNVSMDMLTIDVTDQPNARLGSKVEIWGKNLPVNEVAKGFGTIGYELLCDVNQRVPRVLIK